MTLIEKPPFQGSYAEPEISQLIAQIVVSELLVLILDTIIGLDEPVKVIVGRDYPFHLCLPDMISNGRQ